MFVLFISLHLNQVYQLLKVTGAILINARFALAHARHNDVIINRTRSIMEPPAGRRDVDSTGEPYPFLADASPSRGPFPLTTLSPRSYRAVLSDRPLSGRQSVSGGGKGGLKLMQKSCRNAVFAVAKRARLFAQYLTDFLSRPLQVLREELSSKGVRFLLRVLRWFRRL